MESTILQPILHLKITLKNNSIRSFFHLLNVSFGAKTKMLRYTWDKR